MPGRGLGTSLRTAPTFASGEPEMLRRVDALTTACGLARGRLDEALVEGAEAVARRASGRLRVSTRHTIVAIAGATGSGKSTLFNALCGAEVSVSGPERPTSSSTTALVCGSDDVTDLLDWLAVPANHRHRRNTVAPGTGTSRLPEGVVLLDLPDHDSIVVAHHEEAERVVALADLLVWVVDPQKYADAALHDTLLRPHARHREVMMVVLNHIDTVPPEQRKAMLRDVSKVVAADGIRDPLVLATSARTGIGVDDLVAVIRRRVEEKQNIALRIRADLATSGSQLSAAAGDAPGYVPDAWVADLGRRFGEAAGIPAVIERSRQAVERHVREQLRWSSGRSGGGPTADEPRQGPVDPSAVEGATRDLVENLCRELAPGWADPVRKVATAGASATRAHLDADPIRLPEPELPAWLGLVRTVRVALALGLLGALLLLGLGALGSAGLVATAVGGVLLVAAGGGLLTGQVGAATVAARVARQHAEAAERTARTAVSRVASEHVVGPVNAELATFGQFRRTLDTARS